MKITLFFLAFVAVMATGLLAHRARSQVMCFDAGRVVGGAEQRVFSAKSDGYEPLNSDVTTASKGAPEGCR